MQFKILPLLMLTLALTRCQPRIQPITCADCDSFRCKIDGEDFSANGLWCSPIFGQVLGQSKLVPFRSEIVLFPLSTPFSYQLVGV